MLIRCLVFKFVRKKISKSKAIKFMHRNRLQSIVIELFCSENELVRWFFFLLFVRSSEWNWAWRAVPDESYMSIELLLLMLFHCFCVGWFPIKFKSIKDLSVLVEFYLDVNFWVAILSIFSCYSFAQQHMCT